jgi:hypothetical protein
MSLEDAINRLAAAIEASNAIQTGAGPVTSQAEAPPKRSTPKAATPKVTPAPKPEPGAEAVTKQAVGDKIVALIQANQRAAAVKILNDHGAKALSDVKEVDYQSVYDAASALLDAVG